MTEKTLWHNLPAKKILNILETDAARGLTQEEAQKRLQKYGSNKLPKEKRMRGWKIFWHQLKSPLIFILIIAFFVALILREFIDSGVILAAVLINAILGFFQENKAEKTLYQLRQMVEYHAKVIREEREHLISIENLVPGDIVIVEAGDIIPADCRLLSTHSLQVVEAALTGESIPSNKQSEIAEKGAPLAERENMIYMGTTVGRGKGAAVVISTGSKTEIGKIAVSIKEIGETKTPLQKKMFRLARTIGLIISVACLLIFAIGILSGRPLMEMLLISVAAAVAGIPEGLVIALTICLAIGMQKILKKKALVRKLVAAETLGSVTVICSDKTGTLTEGKMSIAHILAFKDKYEYKENIFKTCLLCNNAIVENPRDELKKWIISGDSTEIALLLGAVQSGFNREEIVQQYPRLDEIPFESEKMYMATLHREAGDGDSEVKSIYLKGALEKVISFCDLEEAEKRRIKKDAEELTAKGLRTLAFAKKEIKKQNNELKDDELIKMKYLGLVALKDPLRSGAKETIKECQRAGIRPIIATGDHTLTAEAIGKEVGLVDGVGAMEARDLEKLSDDELRKEIKKINIFSRVEPRHKIRLVNILRESGEVVAMTGDGVNDALAIKAADIGVALGSGSEVTKEAADIVLLDDNFKTIVDAVKEGRTIFDNIKKIIVYLLSDSFTEIILIAGTIIFGWPLPILAAQILWVNIIEDSLPAIALTYEKSEADVLKGKPRDYQASIFDCEMKFLIFCIGFLTDFILLGLFWFLLKQNHYSLEHIRTVIFVGLGIDSLLYVYCCKSLKKHLWQYNFLDNKLLNLSVFFGLAMLLLAVYCPFFQKVLRAEPLNLIDWLILVALGLVNVALIELGKGFFIKKKRR